MWICRSGLLGFLLGERPLAKNEVFLDPFAGLTHDLYKVGAQIGNRAARLPSSLTVDERTELVGRSEADEVLGPRIEAVLLVENGLPPKTLPNPLNTNVGQAGHADALKELKVGSRGPKHRPAEGRKDNRMAPLLVQTLGSQGTERGWVESQDTVTPVVEEQIRIKTDSSRGILPAKHGEDRGELIPNGHRTGPSISQEDGVAMWKPRQLRIETVDQSVEPGERKRLLHRVIAIN